MNLYEIAEKYKSLLDKNEYTNEDLAELDQIDQDLDAKANSIAYFIKNCEAERDAVHKARKAMQERETKLETRIEVLYEYLKLNLEKCGISEIKSSPYFTIKIRKNPPALFIEAEEAIPDGFWEKKEIRSLSKEKIKSTINDGIDVPGCRVISRTRLEIK